MGSDLCLIDRVVSQVVRIADGMVVYGLDHRCCVAVLWRFL